MGCTGCGSSNQPEKERIHSRLIRKGARGAVGVTKAVLQIDKVSVETRDTRRRICQKCEHFRSKPARCLECSCLIAAKTRIASESCPLKLW